MEPDSALDLDHVFVSVSSEGLGLSKGEIGETSLLTTDVTSDTGAAFVAVGDGTPLPSSHLATRHTRPFISWLWSDSLILDESSTISHDVALERRIYMGMSQVFPPPPPWILKDQREAGRLTPRKRSRPLLDIGPDADVRREHLDATNVRPCFYPFVPLESDVATNEVQVYHNAICAELGNLQIITLSLKRRMYDINNDDTDSFFAWLAAFGDFVRFYLASFEKHVFAALESARSDVLQEKMEKTERKKAKLEILSYMEEIERMKRILQAKIGAPQKIILALCRLSDDLAQKIIEYLNREIEQLPSALSANFQDKQLQAAFDNVAVQMSRQRTACLLHVMLSRGAETNDILRKRWLRKHAQDLANSTFIPQGFMRAQQWERKYNRLHQEYFLAFVRAESEYAEIFV